MARLAKLGAFALTEPLHGSDSVALETSASRDGSDWVINGVKKWIGDARRIEAKGSLRAAWQAEIILNGVRVPGDNRLPGARSFMDAGRVLAYEGTETIQTLIVGRDITGVSAFA